MSEQSRPKKKQKVEPPHPPRAANRFLTPRADPPRSGNIHHGATGASLTNTPTTSVYPTPTQTARKPALAPDSFGSRAARMPAPDFQTLATPYSNLQDTGNPGMSDSKQNNAMKFGSSSGSGSSRSSEESSEESGGSSGESGGSSDDEWSDSDPEIIEDSATGTRASRGRKAADFETSDDLEAHIARLRAGFAKQTTRKPTPSKTRSVPVVSSSSSSSKKPGVVVKVEDGSVFVVKKEEGDPVVEAHRKNLVRNHSLKCLTSLFGLGRAQDAANLVPQYDDSGEPKWFDDTEK
ncbi:hypothetical protein BDV93DRAFT_516955, partial [Ceratobasidium sp. AG-I]